MQKCILGTTHFDLYKIDRPFPGGMYDFAVRNAVLNCESWTPGKRKEGILLRGPPLQPDAFFCDNSTVSEFLLRRPLASVLFDYSEIPDIGDRQLERVQKIVKPRSHYTVAHYRIGRIKPNAGEYFWNSYIPLLLRTAEPHPCGCAKKCMRQSSTARTPLILGGDGEWRYRLLDTLRGTGALTNATWSMSKPANCDLPVCAQLPKFLDRELRGRNSDDNGKDRTFPPVHRYTNTGYSVIMESVIVNQAEYTSFFTEKIFKPIYRGHPFVHACAASPTWPMLRRLGFRSFEPLISPDGLTSPDPHVDCKLSNTSYYHKVSDEMKRIRMASENSWEAARRSAAYNQYAFSCKLPKRLKRISHSTWRHALRGSDVLVPWCDPRSPLMFDPRGRAFCAKLHAACGQSWSFTRDAVRPRASVPHITIHAKHTTAGFGTDLMESAGALTIASALKRPIQRIVSFTEPMRHVFKPTGGLFSAGPYSWHTHDECHKALLRATSSNKSVQVECASDEDGVVVARVAPRIEEALASLKKRKVWSFNPFKAAANASPDEIFPYAPLSFVSHSAIGAFGPSLVWKSLPVGAGAGYSPSSAPRCAISNVLHYVSKDALKQGLNLIGKLHTRNVVAIHLRRGDSAMARECARCVAPDEPDVHSADRVAAVDIHSKLLRINELLQEDDGVFVASDTVEGLLMVKRVLVGRQIVYRNSSRVHSTQFKSIEAARGLAVDFVSMVLADRIFCFGASSLSHNAASLSGKTCE